MGDPTTQLTEFRPQKEFFIGIDSDGCTFDTMEIKIKECFCPQFINHFDLQAVAKYAREVWEFKNLYSKTRGTNRFNTCIGLFGLASGLGATLSTTMAGALAAQYGAAVAFIALAVVGLLAVALAWLAMPETRGCGAVSLSQSATDALLKG